MRARAHAKVNLDLRVLGTRPDGYHELRTVFQSIDLHDTLLCATRPGPFALKCRTSGVPLDESNLVWKAAAALWSAIGRPGTLSDIVISIRKEIPMQAGLGGGSADAAATLLALARLWGGVPLPLIRDVAGGIGADVAYFLSGGTALGLGRGEEIYPLVDLPTHWVVVVQPPYGISTAEAYSWYDDDRVCRRPRASRAADAARSVADACGADDQRSRAAGRAAPSGDWRLQDGPARGRGRSLGDVWQRVCGFWPVSHTSGRRPGAQTSVSIGRPCPADEDAEPRRA